MQYYSTLNVMVLHCFRAMQPLCLAILRQTVAIVTMVMVLLLLDQLRWLVIMPTFLILAHFFLSVSGSSLLSILIFSSRQRFHWSEFLFFVFEVLITSNLSEKKIVFAFTFSLYAFPSRTSGATKICLPACPRTTPARTFF